MVTVVVEKQLKAKLKEYADNIIIIVCRKFEGVIADRIEIVERVKFYL